MRSPKEAEQIPGPGKPMHIGSLTGPILIFGGPYSNLEATLEMRRIAETRSIPPSRIICTGDIVAYCSDHASVVEEIRQWNIPVVMGNCEESLANNATDCGCGFDSGSTCDLLSSTWYRHADSHISESDRFWMASLPRKIEFTLAGHEFLVVHGAPSSINRFIFPSTPTDEKQREMVSAHAGLLIGGHSGIPFGQKVGQGLWLNCGAIGMPANDGTADGWYMTLDTDQDRLTIEWHRLEYDWKNTQSRMRSSGLDNDYALSLQTGLWPSMDILPRDEQSKQGMRLEPAPIVLPII